MGLTRSNFHKRKLTGGRRIPLRIKRKHALARPPAQTKLTANEKRVHRVRTRGGHSKFRALRLDAGSFSWASEAVSRQTRILDVVYNATSNELVRTKTLVKGAIVQLDATPFIQWYYQHYGVHLRKQAVVRQVPTWLAEKQKARWLKRHGYVSTWKGKRPPTAKEAAKKKKAAQKAAGQKKAKYQKFAAQLKQRRAAQKAEVSEHRKLIKARLQALRGKKFQKNAAAAAKADAELQKKSTRKGSDKKDKAPAKKSSDKKDAKKDASKKRRLYKVVKGAQANKKNWLAVPTKQYLLKKNNRAQRKAAAHAKDSLLKKYSAVVKRSTPAKALHAIRRMIKFRRLRNKSKNLWSKRAKARSLTRALEEQLASGKILARISSRPGQCGKSDGYILEDEELAFYLKKLEKKKSKSKK
eukprot:TRINITY_DN31254_c0_g1_i1.p1 TRINITY_DN31254_c0_g1~~TRINITY_DN31254_c0_g1_i1.p1  ORF type:complete len:425 (+),score=123.00 TRINITY_DN31254_c0_g1_i1:41-1276(+)